MSSLDNLLLERTGKNLTIKRCLGGLLNLNFLLTYPKNVVLRIPKENPSLKESIRKEYEGIGYATNGKEYGYRSIQEQIEFCKLCLQKNIPVAGIVDHDKDYMITEFIEGKELPDFLKCCGEGDTIKIVERYLQSLIEAHQKGIVMGDRWGFNTIVTSKKDIVHFDFDIKLTAEDAREFEISQGVYYSLFFSKHKDRIVGYLDDFFRRSEINDLYDKNRVVTFLIGHSEYFKEHDTKYGKIELKVEELTNEIKQKTKATSCSSKDEKTMIFECNQKRYRVPLHPTVAKPEYYTKFLAENIILAENKDEKALDVGVGSGIYITLLLENGYKKIDGIDLNPDVITFVTKIIRKRKLEDRVRLFEGSFPENFYLDERYNLIITNPPQIPSPPEIKNTRDQMYYTNEGGRDGRGVIDKIIKAVPPLLERNGYFQIVQNDFVGIDKTLNLMSEIGLDPTIAQKRKVKLGPFTSSRIDYIESLGYKFQKDDDGVYFYLAIINGRKK